MNPGSLQYYLLIAIALFVFYVARENRLKQWILLLASLVFISFFSIASLATVVLLSIVNFYFAKQVKIAGYSYGKLAVINSFNIGSLLLIRLLADINFTAKISLFHQQGFNQNSLIVLGISFYALQNIAYQVDVYKKRQAPETNLAGFILANAFFARISSGPIMSIHKFNTQLGSLPTKFTEENFTIGLQRVLIGTVKKLVIAERFSYYVNYYFTTEETLSVYAVIVAGFLFTIQLYFDFSGYIDIAVGTARLFGLQLKENFNMPFRSISISEWWRRWHITMIEWFSQYIYYPLTYKFRHLKQNATLIAITATFLVSAVWHGIGITYILWGSCHVVYLILDTLAKKKLLALQQKTSPWVYRLFFIPFTVLLACFSHLFFRSGDMETVQRMMSSLFNWSHLLPNVSLKEWLVNGGDVFERSFNLRLGLLMAILYLVYEKRIMEFNNYGRYRIAWISFLGFIILVFGVFNGAAHFIYMHF